MEDLIGYDQIIESSMRNVIYEALKKVEKNGLPEEILQNQKTRPEYYSPNNRGFERDIVKRLEYWKKLKKSVS